MNIEPSSQFSGFFLQLVTLKIHRLIFRFNICQFIRGLEKVTMTATEQLYTHGVVSYIIRGHDH